MQKGQLYAAATIRSIEIQSHSRVRMISAAETTTVIHCCLVIVDAFLGTTLNLKLTGVILSQDPLSRLGQLLRISCRAMFPPQFVFLLVACVYLLAAKQHDRERCGSTAFSSSATQPP